MARSEKQVSIAYTGTTVEFTFRQADGTFGDKYVFDATKAHADNRLHAELFGWNQRLVDSVADQSGAAAKRAGIVALGDWYMEGGEKWDQKRTATGPRIQTGDIVTALALTYYEGNIDTTNQKVDKFAAKTNVGRDAALMELYKDPAITAAVAKIMRERSAGQTKVNANSLLDEAEASE